MNIFQIFRKFNWGASSSTDEQLDALVEGVSLPPEKLQILDVFPLFVPANFLTDGNWPGPNRLLALPGLGLTWAVERPNQTMVYVNFATAQYWEEKGIDWQKQAMENLAKRTGEALCTAHFPREDRPDESFALVFMHSDGYGPSRLLFSERIKEMFPQGYLVALPEMSCGIALAQDATTTEREKIVRVVQECFQNGTRPLVPDIHDPALLSL